MAISVTFDSNVWRKVASPHRFLKDPLRDAYLDIHSAVKEKSVSASIPETIFNLEAIPRKDRSRFFGTYEPNISSSVVSDRDDYVHMRVKLGPNLLLHPGNSDYLNEHLSDALKLGFTLLGCARIGLPGSPSIRRDMFLKESEQDTAKRIKLFMKAARDIELRGCGISQIRALGRSYATGSMTWLDALLEVPSHKQREVKDGVAEWADADAVAAHIGYGLNYFCTEDMGVSAGPDSVFSPSHREYVSRTYGVRFVTVRELHAEVIKLNFAERSG